MLKTLAMLVTILLGFGQMAAAWVIYESAFRSNESGLWLVVTFFFGFPLACLITWLIPSRESKSWIGLYFERKRLEEQQRIDALKR
jgi:RsiW-degrading membrane proteinase PrsW (M82 family)